MKKILFTAILSIAIFAANAQVNKGSILLGGNISANTSKTTNGSSDAKQTYWLINPSIGYAYKPNRIIGFSLGYGHSNNRNENGINTLISRLNNYSAGVYYRAYFPVGKNFSLYGQSDLGFQYQRRNVTNMPPNNYIEKQIAANLSITPGISYALSKKVMLELGFSNLVNIGYTTTTTNFTGSSPAPSNKTKTFSIGANATPSNSLNIGFRFVLGNK